MGRDAIVSVRVAGCSRAKLACVHAAGVVEVKNEGERKICASEDSNIQRG